MSMISFKNSFTSTSYLCSKFKSLSKIIWKWVHITDSDLSEKSFIVNFVIPVKLSSLLPANNILVARCHKSVHLRRCGRVPCTVTAALPNETLSHSL